MLILMISARKQFNYVLKCNLPSIETFNGLFRLFTWDNLSKIGCRWTHLLRFGYLYTKQQLRGVELQCTVHNSFYSNHNNASRIVCSHQVLSKEWSNNIWFCIWNWDLLPDFVRFDKHLVWDKRQSDLVNIVKIYMVLFYY